MTTTQNNPGAIVAIAILFQEAGQSYSGARYLAENVAAVVPDAAWGTILATLRSPYVTTATQRLETIRAILAVSGHDPESVRSGALQH